jgi:hypothetical protein
MTKITLMAASGSRYSRSRCQTACMGGALAARAVVLIADLLQKMKRRRRGRGAP